MWTAYSEEEDMALGKADKEWIDQQIQQALKGRGWWQKLKLWLKEWSGLGGLVAIFLFALVQWNQNIEFRIRTEDRLKAIETNLLTLRASKAATTPSDKASQTEAKEVIASARQNLIHLPPAVVEQAGKSFVEAAKTDPNAWDVAVQFMAYRSFLNAEDITGPLASKSQPLMGLKYQKSAYLFGLKYITGTPQPIARISVKSVPISQSARVEKIGEPTEQPPEDVGPAFVTVLGGTFDLDGMYLRHVVLSNVEVHYQGGSTILDDVIFINCRFVLTNENKSRELGQQILAQYRVAYISRA